MSRLRVLVVEDSLTVRKHLCEVLATDSGIEVVGEASDGHQAVDLCRSLRPDVVTMDMMLPGMNGLAATEEIMAHCPTPILIVSALQREVLFRTFDALTAGAVEVMDKPSADQGMDEAWSRRFIHTVKLVSRIRVITHLRGKLHGRRPPPVPPHEVERAKRCETKLIAMGASTGGPAALTHILKALPRPLGVPVLIVQHIGDDFGMAFADWLHGQSPHPARYARDGEELAAACGTVILAPPGRHLTVAGNKLQFFDGPPLHSCKPAVDHLFTSIARSGWADCTTACLLTGMGRDGAAGLLDIRRAAGHTIVQDEASCVIYGMPREAVELGAAEQVLPLEAIGPALAAILKEHQGVTR